MEPQQFAPESLSPTILPDSKYEPLDVGYKRMELESKAKALADAAKKAQDAEKQKVRDSFKMPDFGEVFFLQKAAGDKAFGEFEQGLGMIEKNWADNPTNPDLDPDRPGSAAYQQKMRLFYDATQMVKRSMQVKSEYEDALAKYSGRTDIRPEYFNELTEWAKSQEAMRGEAAMPVPTAYVDEGKLYDTFFADFAAAAEKTSKSGPTGTGYMVTEDTEVLSPDKVKAVAKSIASSAEGAALLEANINAMASEDRAVLNEQAKQNGLTPAEQWVYNKNLWRAKKEVTKRTTEDNAYSAKWGSGWGNDKVVADRIVSLIQGVSTGDPKIFESLGIKLPFGQKLDLAITDEMRGMPLSPVMADGKEVPVIFDKIVITDGNTTVYRKRADGEAIEPLKMKTEDFASSITEEMIEGSPELKRGMLYEVMNQRGMIDPESGYINAGQPKNTGGAFTPGITKPKGGAFTPGISQPATQKTNTPVTAPKAMQPSSQKPAAEKPKTSAQPVYVKPKEYSYDDL